MKYSITCDCCGQRVTAYSHNLNRGMAQSFVRMVDRYLSEKRPININTELGLTHNQMANFQKMKHHGIVQNIEGHGWVPTELGLRFFYGEAKVMNPSASMGNKTLAPDHDAWLTQPKSRPKDITLHEALRETNWEYKKRPEFQAEKSAQTTLL